MAHIIIADDDELVTELVQEVFLGYGHVVGAVPNGRAALAAIVAKPPDLVILDCSMPELGGLMTLRRIRLSKSYYNLPLIMLTANRAKVDVDLAIREGADGYVKKPFDPHHLVFRAEEIMAEKRMSWPPPAGLPAGSLMVG